MKKLVKCSAEELREIWEKFGWILFNKFEDYVVEVRKVENDLETGKITLAKLKADNDEKIHQTRLRIDSNSEIADTPETAVNKD